jgi:hypothetical protein
MTATVPTEIMGSTPPRETEDLHPASDVLRRWVVPALSGKIGAAGRSDFRLNGARTPDFLSQFGVILSVARWFNCRTVPRPPPGNPRATS